MFEDIPAWLWAIRLSDWRDIYILDTDELRLRQYYTSTWSHTKERFRIVTSLSDAKHSDDIKVWFLSGSRKFLEMVSLPEGVPRVVWAERCGRRRPPDTIKHRWFSVSHETVGGSTTARGVFGQGHLDSLEIETDPLQRVISHIVKFSIRPTPCSVPHLEPHYRLGHRLSVHHMKQPVLYESCFSRSGWGIRQLSDEEFAQAFDLPSFVLWKDDFATKIVPIQVFRVIIDATLRVIRSSQAGEYARSSRPKLAIKTALPLPLDAEWLADLHMWLPGSWANILIADKAVKSDDAAVEQFPWNQRVLLIFPEATIAAIRGVERLCLRVWFRRLSKSFFEYLVAEYGASWRRDVQRYARSLHERGESPALPLGKRKRSAPPSACAGSHKMGVSTPGSGSGNVEMGAASYAKAAKTRRHHVCSTQLLQDVQCGLRVLRQVSSSSWWEWTGGSSLFFWRWNGQEQIRASRDGIKIFVAASLPSQRRQTAARLTQSQQGLVASKLDTMVKRDYLEPGHVTNTVHYFAVPKGDSDVRVVFDGTSSGLNATLWAPNFFLPSARSAAMSMGFGTWMADMDFGEMFHNFHMDPRIRPFSGVELGSLAPLLPNLSPKENKETKAGHPSKLRWTRLFMGMRPSPYLAIRHYYWGEEFARGNPSRLDNPMGYDKVILNLPGMANYDPSNPKVIKWRNDPDAGTCGGHVAGDVVTFVDDVRITGYSKSNCWKVYHQFASRMQYLGMQNAPRKFRPPSQTNAGAWTGTIFRIGSSHITKSVSQEKWDKGREITGRRLRELKSTTDSRPFLDRRSLEKETGFLNHLSMTFETMIPYLKGLYLTLNSWREGRDENDWKLSAKKWRMILCARAEREGISEEELDFALKEQEDAEAPLLVRASPSLIHDLSALCFMMERKLAPQVSIRSRTVVTVVYGFGDASGSGLGATFTCGSGFNFRIGVWGADEGPESSNWKEFTNVVEALEDEAKAGNLEGSEVYMFTDNSTVESCASRGTSSSPKLLGLVIRLQGLMTRSDVKIHIFHVSGTRMIAQGTDGVSRGYLGQGVMAGESMVAHIPIHISAVARSSNLVPWIRNWCGDDAVLLDEKGWFEAGHGIEGWETGRDGFERPKLAKGRKTYIWSPPPIAAEVALAELRKARIKRQTDCHIIVCPRLCTTQWAKQLYRASDFVFELPVGFSCWTSCMHEPLLIGILFPFLSVRPWQIKGAPKMFAVGRELRKVLEESEVGTRDLLCKLWTLGCDLSTMPEHMVRQLLFL